MTSITLSKRNLFVCALTVVVTIFGIFTLQALLPEKPKFQTSPYSSEDLGALNAAVSGVETFFTVDYREGEDAWLKRVCGVSTTSGCQFVTQGIDPLWEKISSSQSVITAKAVALEKVAKNPSEQVWIIAITLSSPLPGSNKTKDQAHVTVENTEQGWKFNRFLMPEEILALQERDKKNNDQVDEEKKQ